jgi:hypothetical protein
MNALNGSRKNSESLYAGTGYAFRGLSISRLRIRSVVLIAAIFPIAVFYNLGIVLVILNTESSVWMEHAVSCGVNPE